MKINREIKILILSITMQITGFLGFIILYFGRMTSSYAIGVLLEEESMYTSSKLPDNFESFNTGTIAYAFLIFGIIGFIILSRSILRGSLQKSKI